MSPRTLIYILLVFSFGLCIEGNVMEESCIESSKSVIFENQSGITVELYRKDKDDVSMDTLIDAIKHQQSITIDVNIGDFYYFTPKKKRRKKETPRDFMMYELRMQPYSEWIVLYRNQFMIGRDDDFEKEKFIFLNEYRNKNGIEWRSFYPRSAPIHFRHSAKQNGQIIIAETQRTQFRKCTDSLDKDLIIRRLNETDYCRKEQKEKYEIMNLCAFGPFAFQIFNFLSGDECDHLIAMAQQNGMSELGVHRRFWNDPFVQSYFDSLRSKSQNAKKKRDDEAWIDRNDSFIVDNIMRRIADIVNISEHKLHLNESAEAMNIFHYFGDTLYKKHCDAIEDMPNTQYLTVLLYLNEVEKGGNTEFTSPDERCANTQNGMMQIEPIKGSMFFMYNLLEDGNVDRKSEHHNMPPIDSEKWMANIWIWDKVFQQV